MFRPKYVANRFIMESHHMMDKFILHCKSVLQTIDYHTTQLCRSFKRRCIRVKKKVRVRSIKVWRSLKRRCRSLKRRLSTSISKAGSSIESSFLGYFFPPTSRDYIWDESDEWLEQDRQNSMRSSRGICINVYHCWNLVENVVDLTPLQQGWVLRATANTITIPPPTRVQKALIDYVVSEEYDCLALLPFVNQYSIGERLAEVWRQANVERLRHMMWTAGDEFRHDPLVVAASQVVAVEAAATRSAGDIMFPRRRRSGGFERPGRISR